MAKRPSLDKFFNHLLRIANHEDMLPDNMKSFLEEMINHNTEIRDILGDTLAIFIEVYSPYLTGFSDTECEEIKNSITSEMFTASSTVSNAAVKKLLMTIERIKSNLSFIICGVTKQMEVKIHVYGLKTIALRFCAVSRNQCILMQRRLLQR